ncbi:MAG: hypothetical protein QW797_08905, partial [Thermoproteota archaeon]
MHHYYSEGVNAIVQFEFYLKPESSMFRRANGVPDAQCGGKEQCRLFEEKSTILDNIEVKLNASIR